MMAFFRACFGGTASAPSAGRRELPVDTTREGKAPAHQSQPKAYDEHARLRKSDTHDPVPAAHQAPAPPPSGLHPEPSLQREGKAPQDVSEPSGRLCCRAADLFNKLVIQERIASASQACVFTGKFTSPSPRFATGNHLLVVRLYTHACVS